MTLHRIQAREVVLTEIGVEAPDLDEALARVERGAYTQRHRLVIERCESVGFPPMEWAEYVESERAEAHRREVVVNEYDAVAERLASVGKAGAA